jgi:hypothetical protein
MTSIRKIEANKRNASRSTGPRTPGGKLSSRANAQKHGLTKRIEDAPGQYEKIESLAAILSADIDGFYHSRILAGCYFDLLRIRAARYDVFSTMDDLEGLSGEGLEAALRAMDRIRRYETRALSRRRQALRRAESN